MLAAVILSGGESSRMGSPKGLLPFRGRTFLEHLLDIVNTASRHETGKQAGRGVAGIGWTRVVLGPHADAIRRAVPLEPASVVLNPDWKQGQLSSMQAAIRSLPEGETDGMLLFLVDHPLIDAALVSMLIERFYVSGNPVVLPAFRGKRGHPVIFASELYAELLSAPLDKGARAVVWAHAADVLEVPTEEEGVVLNLNDPETLRKVTAMP